MMNVPGRPRRAAYGWTMAAGVAVMAGMFVVSLVYGAANIPFRDVWQALFSREVNDQILIIREIRLPREIAAMVVGAALAAAGAIMQGMTRNPLADPGLLGITAGANLALAVGFAFFPALGYFGMTVAGWIGAAFGMLLVLGLGASRRDGWSPLRLVLAGAAVTFFLYALAEAIGIAFKVTKDVSMWTAGGIMGTTWRQLAIVVPTVAAGLIAAFLYARQLTVLSLSEEVAAGLGQRTALVKAALSAVVILLAGVSVALVGSMAFIGLMVPHIARALVGTDYRRVLPMAAVAGASLLLLADTLARTISKPYETPTAAIIAVLGIPFFLIIARRGGQRS
ncbi:Ferrichrome import ABC transporter, permease protein FhuB [Thermobacillus xylanilyticus]|nr:Ferrichrome import ABC transporter, permease protein FhuB [Thermobacillus xylanilyticus]